jgi:hypothetical protein
MSITKEQFGIWKSHPATQFFFQFLEDRKINITSLFMDAWMEGSAEFEKNSDLYRGRILELLEITDLAHDTIVNFYKEKNSATEIVEDDTR